MAGNDPSDNLLELQPFIQNLGLKQLESSVRALSGPGGNVEVHLTVHQTVHNSTVVKGDVVRGSKTDVNNSEIRTLSVSNENSSPPGPSPPQAVSEPLVQAALPWADGEERDAEEGNDEMVENLEKASETISSARMRMPIKRGQTNTFDTGSQTVKKRCRERMTQTDEDTDVQTKILKLTTNQTQTEIKSYQENKYLTETLDANSLTNQQLIQDYWHMVKTNQH